MPPSITSKWPCDLRPPRMNLRSPTRYLGSRHSGNAPGSAACASSQPTALALIPRDGDKPGFSCLVPLGAVGKFVPLLRGLFQNAPCRQVLCLRRQSGAFIGFFAVLLGFRGHSTLPALATKFIVRPAG